MCGQERPPSPARSGSIGSPIITLIDDVNAVRGHAQTLLEYIERIDTSADHKKKPYLDRVRAIISSPAAPALVYNNGNCRGMLTYAERLGYIYVFDVVGMPNCKGIARSLIGHLRNRREPIKLTPLAHSEAAFRKLGFAPDGDTGIYVLNP
jgi:hypothetical protein